MSYMVNLRYVWLVTNRALQVDEAGVLKNSPRRSRSGRRRAYSKNNAERFFGQPLKQPSSRIWLGICRFRFDNVVGDE